jgi:hypothetical protein
MIPVKVLPCESYNLKIAMAGFSIVEKHCMDLKAHRVQSLKARDENALQKRCRVTALVTLAVILIRWALGAA